MPFRNTVTAAAWALLFLVPNSPVLGSDAPEMQLGGPRNPKVTVKEEGDNYVVEVRFLPVTAFDPATNARLNRGKGQDYALRALAAHLSEKKNSHITISGGEVTKSGLEGNVFKLTFRVSKPGVFPQVEGDDGLEGSSPEVRVEKRKKRSSFPARSVLFTRKDDFLDTLDRLHENYTTEAERAYLVLDAGEYSAHVRQLSEEAGKNIDRITTEIKEDKLLDFIQRADLTARVERDRNDILDRLKEPVESRGKQ